MQDFIGYPSARTLDRRRAEARAAADDARRAALAALDDLGALLNRHDGDSGEDAALIEAWTDTITGLADEVRAVLGEPRVRLAGGLVPAAMVRGAVR